MDTSLATLINLYTLSTGRRLFALAQTMKAAKEHGFEELAVHCQASIEHDTQTRSLETKWAAPTRPSAAAARVARADHLTDRTLVAIRDTAQAQASAADEGDGDLAARTAALLTAIFPRGVQAVTHAAQVDQLSAVDGIVSTLQSADFAPVAAELGLDRLAKRLAALAVEYREALEAPAAGMPFGVVRAARATGQENVLRAIAMVLGKHGSSSPEDVAARNALLAPILKQNEAVRLYLRSRRAIQDVNPDTGEIDPTAPTGDPDTAAPSGEPQPA